MSSEDYLEIESLIKNKKKARRRGNTKALSETCRELGVAYTNIGKYDDAKEELTEALEISTSDSDFLDQAKAHRFFGEVFMKQGLHKIALQHHGKYLDLAVQCKSQVEEQRAYTTLGNTYLDIAQVKGPDGAGSATSLRNAEECFNHAMILSEKVKSVISVTEYAEMKAGLFTNFALIWELKGDLEKSIQYFLQSIKLSEEHKFHENLFRNLYNMADCLKKNGKAKEALEWSKKALSHAHKIKCRSSETAALFSMARIHLDMSNFVHAKDPLISLYKMKKPCDDEDSEKQMVIRTLKRVIKLVRLLEDLENIPKKDAKSLFSLYKKIGTRAAVLDSNEFAVCCFKNMEKCTKVLNLKDEDLRFMYSSMWKSLKELRKFHEVLIYLDKEAVLWKNNHKALYRLNMEKAEILELSKADYESIKEAYDTAYKEAEMLNSNKKQIRVLKKLLAWQKNEGKGDDFVVTKRILDELSPLKTCVIDGYNIEEENDGNGDDDDEEDMDECSDNMSQISDDEEIELDKEFDMCSDEETDEKSFIKDPKRNAVGETPLHRASIEGDLRRVKLLLNKGHKVNLRDYSGWLPIHEAASHGFVEIAELLLDAGASINDRGGKECQGFTPLHDACTNGHTEVIQLFIRRGADLLAKNDEGELGVDIFEEWCNNQGEDVSQEAVACLNKLKEATERQKATLLSNFRHGVRSTTPSSKSERPILSSVSSLGPSTTNASSSKSNFHRKTMLSMRSTSPPSTPTTSSRWISNEDNRTNDIEEVSSPEPSQRRRVGGGKVVAVKEYKEAISRVKKPLLSKANTSLANQNLKTALIPESEFIDGDDWLVDDSKAAVVENSTNNSIKSRTPKTWQSSTTALLLSRKAAQKRKSPDEDTNSNEDEHDESRSREMAKKKSRKVIGGVDDDDGRRCVDRTFVADSDLENESEAKSLRGKSRADVNESLANVSLLKEVNRSPGDPQKWVKVRIEDRLVAVPINDRDGRTVSWLAEEASMRHYVSFSSRPKLTLVTPEGFILMPFDPIAGLLKDGQEITGSVVDWEEIPLETRYTDACKHLGCTAYSNIKSQLSDVESTNFLNLTRKNLQLTQLRPVCHVLQSFASLTELHLGGNKLKNDGFRSLIGIFRNLSYLSVLDVSSNQLTSESILALSQHLTNEIIKKSLQSLRTLNLGGNHLTDVSSTHLFTCIEHLVSLTRLDLSACQLTEKFFGNGEQAIHSFQGSLIVHLDLSQNEMERIDMKLFFSCFNFGRLQTLKLPTVCSTFVEGLRSHLTNTKGKVDFKLLCIDGRSVFPEF